MSRPLRILHAGDNIAGLPALLAGEQRRLGYQATALLYQAPGPATGVIDLRGMTHGPRGVRRLKYERALSWAAHTYDIFHFHFFSTFRPDHSDVAWLKRRGKRVVFHLHGCDIRDPRLVRQRYAVNACAECTVQCLHAIKLGLPEAMRRYADAVIVATPDLLEFVDGATYVPNPLEVERWAALGDRVAQPHAATGSPLGASPRRPDEEYVIVHAPTNREIKGTRHVVAAVDQLRAEGLPVRLRLLEGLPREEMLRACRDADVAVDQVLIGWYGLFALEMLALGKPVVAYIRPDLRGIHPDLPIASADPSTLAGVLRDLLQVPERRQEAAIRGPAFVRAHHDPAAATRRILELYACFGEDR